MPHDPEPFNPQLFYLRLGRVPHSTVKVIAVIRNVILATGLQPKQYGSIFRFVAPHCRGL